MAIDDFTKSTYLNNPYAPKKKKDELLLQSNRSPVNRDFDSLNQASGPEDNTGSSYSDMFPETREPVSTNPMEQLSASNRFETQGNAISLNPDVVKTSSNVWDREGEERVPIETNPMDQLTASNRFDTQGNAVGGTIGPQTQVNEPQTQDLYDKFGGNNPDDPGDDSQLEYPTEYNETAYNTPSNYNEVDVNDQNGQLGLTLQNNLTEQGNLYEENVLKDLTGENANVTSARNKAGRDNRFQNYYDDKSIKESLAQSGLEPGTLEYQRALDRVKSGTNQANLQRDNNVNQLQRDYYGQAMQDAKGIENNQYNRSVNAEGELYNRKVNTEDKRYSRDKIISDEEYNRNVDTEDKRYGRELDQYFDEKSDKLMDKQDIQSFINDQPQKIQNILSQIQMSGGDVQAAIKEMYENGTIKEGVRPRDQFENLMDESTSYYNQLVPRQPGETDEQWKARRFDSNDDGQITAEDQTVDEAIYDRFKNLQETIDSPIGDATGDRDAKTEADTRIDDFITNGGDLSSSDWKSLQNDATKMEALRSSDNFVDWNKTGRSENTGSDWEYSVHKVEDIEASWQKNNPLGRPEAKGMIIEKDGELYVITDPMYHGKNSSGANRVEILMEPVGGGAEVILIGSEGWRWQKDE